jgi:hypothetical protein
MMSSELKEITTKKINAVINNHKKNRSNITDEILKQFYS